MHPTKTMVARVLPPLLGAYFALNGALKLASHPHMVESFARWGYGHSFLALVGVVELGAGAALAFRRSAFWAAGVLAAVMAGATFTHVTHAEWAHALIPVVVTALLAVVAVRSRPDRA